MRFCQRTTLRLHYDFTQIAWEFKKCAFSLWLSVNTMILSLGRLHGGDNVQIKRYFVSFWNGVDLRYKLLKGPRIRISIAGIIISRVSRTNFINNENLKINHRFSVHLSNYVWEKKGYGNQGCYLVQVTLMLTAMITLMMLTIMITLTHLRRLQNSPMSILLLQN